MKQIYSYILAGMSLLATTSCSDFLDTAPYDSLSPETTWKTETDAEKFLVGCYDGWISGTNILYWDCASDFGYNNFPWEGFNLIGNGSISAGEDDVADFYGFGKIRQCNDFLTNIENVPFADEAKKKSMIAQVKTIRAYEYFTKNWIYGGIPIIESYFTSEEAMVPRNTEAQVNEFIENELDAAISMFSEDKASTRGYIDRGTALALKMRHALYYENWERAKNAAQDIIDLGVYSLEPDFLHMFSLQGKDSPEIIASAQAIKKDYSFWLLAAMYNNGDGGWSSVVPTQNLVDTYEMNNGLTKEEAGSGYDPVHPFANRDPRMAMTVLYPGMDWVNINGEKEILNTLDEKLPNGKNNPNHPTVGGGNASKTGLTWGKYLLPLTQYDDYWDTSACIILFRYAEVLLSWAEAENELNGPSAEVYAKLNMIRNRVGMPEVDDSKYNTKETLRELIHRERSVELAGEGLRRADILRWKDDSGKMIAETVMNKELVTFKGTINYEESDPEKRAVINTEETLFVESRLFRPYYRYLPINQKYIDKNGQIEQNPGY